MVTPNLDADLSEYTIDPGDPDVVEKELHRSAHEALHAQYNDSPDGADIVQDSDIGVSVQAYDAVLGLLSTLTAAADRLPYFDGASSAAVATFTSFARSLLDDADAATARATLGLVIGTNVQAYDSDLAAVAALTTTAYGRALLTLADQAALQTAVNVEDGATADQTGAEIKASYEAEADTNAYDDAAVAKLAGIEAAADVTDATNVASAGAHMAGGTDVPVTDGGTGASTASAARTNLGLVISTDVAAEGHSHTESDVSDLGVYPDATGQPATKVAQTDGANGWTFIDTPSGGAGTDDQVASEVPFTPAGDVAATDVQAAIVELDTEKSGTAHTHPGTYHEVGGTDVPVTDGGTGASTAAAARTNLDVDQAGTDNSTDVTLAGTPDYLTIAGQTITRGLVDLTTDVTGDLPVTEGGTGSSTASAARTALGVAIGTDVQAHSAVLDATTGTFTTADESKLDAIEASADVTDAANVAAAGALMDSDLLDEDDMATDSATRPPSQQSVKAYVDASVDTVTVSRQPVLASGTLTQAHVWVTGRDSPDEQTIVLRHLDTDGTTLLNTLDTVVVALGNTTTVNPSTFSQAITAGQFIEVTRTGGTGVPPQVDIYAAV